MTSTMSRLQHNYISLLGISCRINCIVSACPLCDSRVSLAPSVALGDVAIRSATPRKPSWRGGSLNPFGVPPMLRARPHVLCSLSTTSLISSPSPRCSNYQQSVFGHVLRSSGVQLAEDFREAFSTLWLIVIYARNLCAGQEISKLTSFDVSLSPLLFTFSWRGEPVVCLNCL